MHRGWRRPRLAASDWIEPRRGTRRSGSWRRRAHGDVRPPLRDTSPSLAVGRAAVAVDDPVRRTSSNGSAGDPTSPTWSGPDAAVEQDAVAGDRARPAAVSPGGRRPVSRRRRATPVVARAPQLDRQVALGSSACTRPFDAVVGDGDTQACAPAPERPLESFRFCGTKRETRRPERSTRSIGVPVRGRDRAAVVLRRATSRGRPRCSSRVIDAATTRRRRPTRRCGP